MAQWIEHWPANQTVTGLNPSQGACMGCGPGPPVVRCAQSNHTLMFAPLSFSFPSPLSKSKYKSLKKPNLQNKL